MVGSNSNGIVCATSKYEVVVVGYLLYNLEVDVQYLSISISSST